MAYPKGVTDLGLEAVWDLQQLMAPATEAQAFPSTVQKHGSVLRFTGDTEMVGFDLKGFSLLIDGAVNVTFRQSLLRGVKGATTLDIGVNYGAPKVICDGCDIDLGGIYMGFESGIRHYKGDFELRNSILHNAPLDYLTKTSPGSFTAVGNFIRSPGLAAPEGEKIAHLHLRNGVSIVLNNFFEVAIKPPFGQFGSSIWIEGDEGQTQANLGENIFVGTQLAESMYPIQVIKGLGVTVDINRNCAEPGTTGGFVGKEGSPAVGGVGNLDLDGASLAI